MKWLPVLPFLLLPAEILSQNLLVNADFEDENICTEYEVNCAPEGWIANRDGFSIYFNDTNRAYSGRRFVAIEAANSANAYQRTFLRSRLLCGLRKDHRYRLEFFIKSPHDILDSIGVLFTSFDFLYSKTRLHRIAPSMFVTPSNGTFLQDSGWQKVSMDFPANGTESFITLANFSKRDVRGGLRSRPGHHFFVYIDSISLVPLDAREVLCAQWKATKEEIYQQDERHEFLRMKIRQNNDSPPVVTLPVTKLVSADSLLLPDGMFETAKADLRAQARALIGEFLSQVKGKRVDSVVIEGYAANTGNAISNSELSVQRAAAVGKELQRQSGIPGALIVTRGGANEKPLAGNRSAAGIRKVQLVFYTSEQ